MSDAANRIIKAAHSISEAADCLAGLENDPAARIVGKMLNDLLGRGGIDNVFDEIDRSTQTEIVRTLYDIADNEISGLRIA